MTDPLERCGRLICNRTRLEHDEADAECALDDCPFRRSASNAPSNRPFLTWPDESFRVQARPTARPMLPEEQIKREVEALRMLLAAERVDARLIAAAPDLLEACRELIARLGPDYAEMGPLEPERRALDQAGAAIAKATGEPRP